MELRWSTSPSSFLLWTSLSLTSAPSSSLSQAETGSGAPRPYLPVHEGEEGRREGSRVGRCGILGRGNTGSREGQGFSPSSCMLTTYSYTNALKYPEPKYSRLPSPPPSSLLQALMSGSMGRIGGGLMGTPTASTANAAAAASALSPCLGLSSPGFLQVGQGKCGMQMGTVPRRCRPAWGCRHLSSCRWGRGSVGCKCEHGPPHVVVCLHGASFSLHLVPLFPTSPTSSSLPPSFPSGPQCVRLGRPVQPGRVSGTPLPGITARAQVRGGRKR